jgi:DNA-binding phage protein
MARGFLMEEQPSRFDQIRERRLQSPEFRARYRRTKGSIARVQKLLQMIEARRQETGLMKVEVAERAGINPAALRRLLTSGTSNPTLKTVLDVMDALGLEMRVELTPEHQLMAESGVQCR